MYRHNCPCFPKKWFQLNFDCKAYPSFTALKLLQAKIWGLKAKNCSLFLQACPSHSISKSSTKPEPFHAEQLKKSPGLQCSGAETTGEVPKEILPTNINRWNQTWFCNSIKWPKKALKELDGAGFVHSDKEAIIIDRSVTSHQHQLQGWKTALWISWRRDSSPCFLS